jgi:ribonucleotide monophosphatase NagD (HAD superfamily)
VLSLEKLRLRPVPGTARRQILRNAHTYEMRWQVIEPVAEVSDPARPAIWIVLGPRSDRETMTSVVSSALEARGKRVVFVTNNASRTPRECAAKLMRMRIPTDPTDVVTSAHAVERHLRGIGIRPGAVVHVCGAGGLERVLRAAGYLPTTEVDGVEALVVGWNPKLTYEDLRRAADVARSGVPFVAANRDATYPTADGEVPGTGAIVAAIEQAAATRS